MSIVVMKCDTCKREIELQRNIRGLESVGRCTITHGCRGSLYQVKLHPDYIRGTIPDSVTGLDDWKQRKILHDHTQTIERNEWTITHNMGVVPAVSVFVDRPIEGDLNNREEITPQDVIPIDSNTIKLVFDRAWSGIAQLVSRQSDPDLLRPTTRELIETEDAIQISNQGEITIATRVNPSIISPDLSASVISLVMEYDTTSGAIIQELYSADDTPTLLSPWNGSEYDRIVVNVNSTRQPYTVRSFNALTQNMTSGNIDSGSTFKFNQVDPAGTGSNFRDIDAGEIIILLASKPFDNVDKLTDQYIDVLKVTPTLNPFGFFYNNGEFFATPDIVTRVFPQILNID